MNYEDYSNLVYKNSDNVINELDTSVNNDSLNAIKNETIKILLEHKDDSYKNIVLSICKEYLESVKAILKLSPGLSTGIRDEKDNITLNTYDGFISSVSSSKIDENVVFDCSSMTKMFSSLLMLKEFERGNIDLNRNYSDYSSLFGSIDCRILDALKFGVELRTDGRIDEVGLSDQEIIRSFLNTKIINRNTFIYSDIPYMLLPYIYGDDLTESSYTYLDKFYDLYFCSLCLSQTSYSTKNMTGGIINSYKKNGKTIYELGEYFDPKANIFLNKLHLVSSHAGLSTTVSDLERLFSYMYNGFFSEELLKELITPVIGDRNAIVNRAMGVYIYNDGLRNSFVPDLCSKSSFASQGSSGTYSLFDIKNGFNFSYLSNIKTSLKSKKINTEDYVYGNGEDYIKKNTNTIVFSGSNSLKDGSIQKEDGTFMPHVKSTDNFKEEALKTLIMLRIAKRVLSKTIQDYNDVIELEDAFNISITNNQKRVLSKKYE